MLRETNPKTSFFSLEDILDSCYSVTTNTQHEGFNNLSDLQTVTFLAFQGALDSTSDPFEPTTVLASDSEARLSAEEQKAFFLALGKSLDKKENIEHGFTSEQIQAALLKNPTMMRNMKKLQDAGAELVVVKFENGIIEFADAAQNLNIKAQEAVLAALTAKERQAALEQILASVKDDHQKKTVRSWLEIQLYRPDDVYGLNLAEAFLFAAMHRCSLIGLQLYTEMAKGDANVYENRTLTWLDCNIPDAINSGRALAGDRVGGVVLHGLYNFDCRDGSRGGRVAGLKLPIDYNS